MGRHPYLMSLKSYYKLDEADRNLILEDFRTAFTEERAKWSLSLSKKNVANRLNISQDLSSYLSVIVDRVEPLENQKPPETYLCRRSFLRLDVRVQQEIIDKIKTMVMDKVLHTKKIRLMEAEREVSRETKFSVALVREYSPSIDMIQKRRGIYK